MLVVNQQERDLGKVTFGKPFHFKYILTNEGNKLIKITRIVLGCGSCTKASADKSTLAPGDQTAIDTIFTPGSSGLAAKTVSIEYQEGGVVQSPLVLKFRAQVVNV